MTSTSTTVSVKIKQSRRPKFRRASDDVRFRLQERDLQIVLAVWRYRFLSSDILTAIISGSPQRILRRLNLLFHAGYLDRPREQIKPWQSGSSPMVYGLGNKGVDMLSEQFGFPRQHIDWTSKNRDSKELYIAHTLMIATFLVSLKLACERQSGIEFIEQSRIVQGEPILKVNFNREVNGRMENVRFNLIPDCLFGLRLLNEPSDRSRAFFLGEMDRATMPILRSDFYRSSILKKIVGYRHCKNTGAFKKTFGFENPRIVTVTTSHERIDNMIAACRKIYGDSKGAGMFLFSTADNFTPRNVENVLRPIWRNAADDKLVGILD